MSNKNVENSSFVVPIGMGHLIGNTLRQFAMRGTHSWQIAAFRVGPRVGTYGFSNNHSFSCLDLIDGKLVSNEDCVIGAEKSYHFEFQNGHYVAEGSNGTVYIENLGNLGVQSMQVCLVCANGTRTAEQNSEVAVRFFGSDSEDFYAVPSRHTPTITFKFEVIPRDFNTEQLSISATAGAVSSALDSLQIVLRNLQSISD